MNGHRSLIYVRETLGWEAEHEALGFLHYALYEEGKNISSIESCVEEIAKVNGIDPSAAMNTLNGGAFIQTVLKEDYYAKRKLGVESVPHFYVMANGKQTEFDGAVNAERFVQTIERMAN
jgi:predicted DsbA family dithiol-disulfide isomerase